MVNARLQEVEKWLMETIVHGDYFSKVFEGDIFRSYQTFLFWGTKRKKKLNDPFCSRGKWRAWRGRSKKAFRRVSSQCINDAKNREAATTIIQADVLPQQSTERIDNFLGSNLRSLCLMHFLLRPQPYELWSPRNLTGIILTIYLYFMFCCSILTKRMRKLLVDEFTY